MLAENPIAKFEFAALQRTLDTKRPGYWLRLVFYFGILLVAVIPLFIYIDETFFPILVLMLIIIFLAQLILMLNTLAQAIEQTLHQRQNGMWDVLILTGMSARQMITGKSNAIVQTLWGEWIILALARFGVALGFAHYLHAVRLSICYPQFPDGFCYPSWSSLILHPHPLVVLIALFTIIVVTRLELRLISLIGICASLFPSKAQVVNWMVAVLLLLTVIGCAFLGLFALDQLQSKIAWERMCAQGSYCGDVMRKGQNMMYWQNPPFSDYFALMTDLRRVIDVSQVGMSAFVDGGTLLAAHIMRPEIYPRLIIMLRGIISVLIAVTGYKIANWFLLTLAQRLAIKQGALPEARKRIKINKLYWLKRITGFA